VTRTRR